MKEHIEKVKHWYENEPDRIFIISGYAGCGKTTFAKKIANILGVQYNTAYLTPTGKAATVLGNGAQTLHSYIYDVEEDSRTHELYFRKKDVDSLTHELIVLDEISMVNDEMLEDLMSTNIPIIGLGDPAQLPPVKGSNKILDNYDVLLTKVWRNDGGILELATDIRQGNKFDANYDNVEFRQTIIDDVGLIDDNSIVICRYNATRTALNAIIRKQLKRYDKFLELGEKLMILENSRKTGLMNGSIVTVLSIDFINDSYHFAQVKVKTQFGQILDIKINTHILLNKPRKTKKRFDDNMHTVDYAYAITCHKSQGSEFDKVFVIVEGSHFDDFQYWLYTAVTRAKTKLYIYGGQT